MLWETRLIPENYCGKGMIAWSSSMETCIGHICPTMNFRLHQWVVFFSFYELFQCSARNMCIFVTAELFNISFIIYVQIKQLTYVNTDYFHVYFFAIFHSCLRSYNVNASLYNLHIFRHPHLCYITYIHFNVQVFIWVFLFFILYILFW